MEGKDGDEIEGGIGETEGRIKTVGSGLVDRKGDENGILWKGKTISLNVTCLEIYTRPLKARHL